MCRHISGYPLYRYSGHDAKSRRCQRSTIICSCAAGHELLTPWCSLSNELLADNKGEMRYFCAPHKKNGVGRMENFKNRTCLNGNCPRVRTFGFANEKVMKFCSEHQEIGMVDLRHRRCASEGCSTQPKFGLPGGKREYCSYHSRVGMVNLDYDGRAAGGAAAPLHNKKKRASGRGGADGVVSGKSGITRDHTGGGEHRSHHPQVSHKRPCD